MLPRCARSPVGLRANRASPSQRHATPSRRKTEATVSVATPKCCDRQGSAKRTAVPLPRIARQVAWAPSLSPGLVGPSMACPARVSAGIGLGWPTQEQGWEFPMCEPALNYHKAPMSDTVETLILDLLKWIGPDSRPYSGVLDAWRISCPRLPVWENANDRGFVERRHEFGHGRLLSVSVVGREHLRKHRPTSAAAVESLLSTRRIFP